jgi:hypothetical protein
MAKTYCPTCLKPIEPVVACGATTYFCEHCKLLVSSKKVLNEDQLKTHLADDSTNEEK